MAKTADIYYRSSAVKMDTTISYREDGTADLHADIYHMDARDAEKLLIELGNKYCKEEGEQQ